jgi:hypothetical protein
MKVKLAQFKDLCLTHGLLAPDSVLNSLYKELLKLDGTNEKASEFIKAYCDAFKHRYGVHPHITGKTSGIATRVVKDLGLEEACALVNAYLSMNDSFFQLRHHDLATFELNLTKVQVQLETGKTVNQTQARRLEQTDANAQAIQSYLKKKHGTREPR